MNPSSWTLDDFFNASDNIFSKFIDYENFKVNKYLALNANNNTAQQMADTAPRTQSAWTNPDGKISKGVWIAGAVLLGGFYLLKKA